MISLITAALLLAPVGPFPLGTAVYRFEYGYNFKHGSPRIIQSARSVAYFVLPQPITTNTVIENPENCFSSFNGVAEACSLAVFNLQPDYYRGVVIVNIQAPSGRGTGNIFALKALTVPGTYGLADGALPSEFFGSLSFYQAVPEPATWALLVTGFGLVGVVARRRPKSASCDGDPGLAGGKAAESA